MSNKILLPQLVSMLASASGKPKKQAETFLKSFLLILTETLEEHESVKIKGFGTFKVNRVEARKSVNVSTGAAVQIPAHYKVVFTPDKAMAQKVNKEFAWLDIVELSDNVSNAELESIAPKEEIPTVEMPEEVMEEVTLTEEIPTVESYEEPVIDPKEIPVVVEVETPREFTEEVQEKIASDLDLPESAPEEMHEENSEIIPEHRRIITEESRVASLLDQISAPVVTTVPNAEVHEMQNERLTEEQEQQSEHLGEELEKDFGEIEPVEPFGPIDPEDPEPGEPIPEDISEPAPMMFYVTKEEAENFATKNDVKVLKRNLKKIKAGLEKSEADSRRRSRNALIWSWVLGAALMVGGFFLVYAIIMHRLNPAPPKVAEPVKKIEAPVETIDDEDEIQTTISGLSADSQDNKEEAGAKITETKEDKREVVAAVQQQKSESSTAPTSPSDIKAMDKITTTRYLTTMAKEHYGNYNLWPYIYIENEGKLGHPDRIKPGTPVVIPNIEKFGINPSNPKDIEKARKLGVEIYRKYSQSGV